MIKFLLCVHITFFILTFIEICYLISKNVEFEVDWYGIMKDFTIIMILIKLL